MSRKTHSREAIIQSLQNLAKSLKKDGLTKAEAQSVVPSSSIRNHFGSLGNALEAAGLQRTSLSAHLAQFRKMFTDDELFTSLVELESQLGHEPGYNEYVSQGKYSAKPFRKRFGHWAEVVAHYRKWKSAQGKSIGDDAHERLEPTEPPHHGKLAQGSYIARTNVAPAQLYGEPIDFRGLRHAPINEQGVVYLFGMVSRELGFYVESVQQGFPDCEGKYLYDPRKNLWAKARIEFEFRASSFREHGHDPAQCDFIVCWLNDWPDCPIQVIELKREILRLPQN